MESICVKSLKTIGDSTFLKYLKNTLHQLLKTLQHSEKLSIFISHKAKIYSTIVRLESRLKSIFETCSLGKLLHIYTVEKQTKISKQLTSLFELIYKQV